MDQENGMHMTATRAQLSYQHAVRCQRPHRVLASAVLASERPLQQYARKPRSLPCARTE